MCMLVCVCVCVCNCASGRGENEKNPFLYTKEQKASRCNDRKLFLCIDLFIITLCYYALFHCQQTT